MARFGTLLQAQRLFQVNFDVVPGADDVPNDAAERKAAQIAVAEPSELSGVRVDARGTDVAPFSLENRAQLARELRFERVFGARSFHAPSLVRE